MEENIKYYDAYEENLLKELIRTCSSLGMMDRDLLTSEDIDQKWKEWAADYIAEALPEVNSYPECRQLREKLAEYYGVDYNETIVTNGSDEVLNFEVSGEKIEAVHMLPGYTHNIINLSETEDLVTVMWANEQFDPERPDTLFEKV